MCCIALLKFLLVFSSYYIITYLLQALQPDHHGTELDFITLTVTYMMPRHGGSGATLLELGFFFLELLGTS